MQTFDRRAGFERDFPTPAAVQSIFDAQDLQRALLAYRFFYPTVSMEAIIAGNRDVGAEDGVDVIVMATRPHHLVFTANSDTPYAAAVLDLSTHGPIMVELPAGPYMGVIDDHNHRWILDMGIPGPDAGRGGRHLVLPPGFSGAVPAGLNVGRSPTYKAFLALRALPRDRGASGALDALRKVKVHSLSRPDAPMRFQDVTNKDLDSTPLRWEGGIDYWKHLHEVIQAEPVLEEFRPMYGALAALGIEKGRPFAPDQRMQCILETASRVALDQMRVEGFASLRPDILVWKDRKWEWIAHVSDDANFETRSYLDLQARDRWFVQAILASPAMFRRRAGGGSVYFLAARDRDGAYLDGAKTYKLTVPEPVPASLFWSVTAYDSRTRSQLRTPQESAVLSSLKASFERNAQGAVELYFGPEPATGREKQWIQSAPGTGFFLYFRIYGPEPASLDGTWKLADLEPL